MQITLGKKNLDSANRSPKTTIHQTYLSNIQLAPPNFSTSILYMISSLQKDRRWTHGGKDGRRTGGVYRLALMANSYYRYPNIVVHTPMSVIKHPPFCSTHGKRKGSCFLQIVIYLILVASSKQICFGPEPKSLYQSTSLSVSECVWMFPNSSETANPSDLKF